MNRSTFRKILGDIWARKGRTALVSISIFIGVLGVVTLITAGDLLVRQLKADIQEQDLPMMQVFMTIPPSEEGVVPDDAALLADLREQIPGVTAVQGQASNPFYWRFPGDQRFREAYLLSYSGPLGEQELQPMRLVEGAYPMPGQGQLAVEQRMAEDFDLSVGDTIELQLLGQVTESSPPPVETWTISGIIFHAYNSFSKLSMYAAAEDAPDITGITGLSTIGLRFTEFDLAWGDKAGVQQWISDNSPYMALFFAAEDPAENSLIKTTAQFAQILTALAIVAMLVSGFLVLNVINNLVVEQQRQIGVMKSLGATRVEIGVIYAGIALVYGLLGMVPGVLLGIPLGYEMAVIVGDFANTLIDSFSISPVAVALGMVLGLAVPVGSAILPVYAGTRVTILEAMTDLGIGGGYRFGLVNRLITALPLPLNIKQSLNSISQKKARMALTVITLTLAVAAFMGVSAVFVRLDDLLDEILAAFQYQIIFTTTESQDYESTRDLIMANVNGVAEVAPGSMAVADMQGYVSEMTESSQIMIQGIETAQNYDDVPFTEGHAWMDDPTRSGIVLTNEITNQLDKHVGDMATITVGGKSLELEIIGIMNYPFPIGIMPWRDLAELAGFTKGAPVPNRYFTALTLDGYAGTLPDGQITALGIDAQAAAFLPVEEGEGIQPGTPGVLLTRAAADAGGYAVGDELTFAGADGPVTVPVLGIFAVPAQMADPSMPQDAAVFFWEDLAELEGKSLTGDPVPNAFFVLLDEGDPSARDVDAVIEEINATLVDRGITASYTNMIEIADQASQAILSIGIVLNVASAIMAAVGAIGLLTTLSISVFERQKEIGVMRSVGARSPTIIVQFLVEGILVGLIAWAIAVPLSYLLAWGLTEILPFGDFIEFEYPLVLLPLGLAGVMLIATVSSIWPSVSAARKTVSDILRYQ